MPRPSAPPLAVLLVRHGQLRGERLLVRGPVVNIGRAAYNDLRLPDPSVGASHARLQLREGVWMFSDLGSTQGSAVDGEPVTGEAPLPPGALLSLGEVQLSFDPRDATVPPPIAALPSGAPELDPAARRRPPPAAPTRLALRRWFLLAGMLLGSLLLAGYLVLV
ncbi:MAG TPA: FHA domain-containing protein [Gemmatimonadales bacterium]|nr:FHA domain-containing protein [Gemmatimonadales bacterium]